jgi:multidrug efflux pump subunit AcrA (membrane-fusion protein)
MKQHQVIIAFLLGAILLTGCAVMEGFAADEVTPTPLPVVENKGIVAEGRIVPRDHSSLVFLMGGTISEVLVDEGQRVSKDQVLVRLKDREQAEAALSLARAEELSAQQGLDKLNEKALLQFEQARAARNEAEKVFTAAWETLDELDTQETLDDIDDARSEVVDLQDDLKEKEDNLDKYLDLSEDNATRNNAQDEVDTARQRLNEALRKRDGLIQDLNLARARYDLADQQLADARTEVEKRQNGEANADDLALAQARLKSARAQVVAAEATLQHLELKAPFDGVVVDLRVSESEPIAPNQTVLVLADLSTLFVETTDLRELDVVNIKEGDTVKVIPDALPEVELPGEVVRIGQYPEQRGGDVVYRVRIRLLEVDDRLRWGMTVDVNFKEHD